MTWKRTWMGLLAASCISCAGDASQAPIGDGEDGELGNLALNLTGVDRQGQQYRLRNAEFDIGGYTYYPYPQPQPSLVTVSSEDDPEAEVISTRLASGEYYVTLSNHRWYLEKLTDQGPERVDRAVLLSPESQYAYVYDHGTTSVYFSFGVDGELIDFHSGTLQIGITIEHPDDDGGVASPDPDPDQDAGVP